MTDIFQNNLLNSDLLLQFFLYIETFFDLTFSMTYNTLVSASVPIVLHKVGLKVCRTKGR